jgi:hypothetical protein
MKRLKQLLVLLAAVLPTLLQAQTLETFTFTTNRIVPDGDPSGLSDVRNVNTAIGYISSLKVRLTIAGEFNGDLYGYLRHTNGFTVLLNRVGRTASNPDGYGDSGLNVEFATGAANGDIHLYENVLKPVPGLPLTGTWEPDGRSVDPTNVLDTSPRTASLINFNGLAGNGEWTLFLADMESGGTNMLVTWTLEISGGAFPTLTWPNPADIAYGTALSGAQLNATATYGSTNVPGTFTYSPTLGTVLNAGSNQTLTVTFTPSNTNSFLPVTTTAAINVTPAPLTIAANNTSKTYGDPVPTFSAAYTGFVNGDGTNNLSAQETLASAATVSSDVGAYTITASGATAANYTITHVNGTLTINPASITVAADSKTKIYGAALPALTATYTGFVLNQTTNDLASVAGLSTPATISSPAGVYPITASGATSSNYTFTYVPGTLTVTPASIMIAADNKSKVYGAALPAFTATYSGFALGQSTNDLTALATVSSTATASSPVGTYPITASGATSSNYTFTYVGGTLTITQALTLGSVASSANPALPGTNVTFTMTVGAVAPGAGTPSGTVNFRIDGSIAGSGNLSGGVAAFSTSSLSHGSHTVAAEYAGDSNFVGTSNSLAQSEVINTPPVAGNLTLQRNPAVSLKVRVSTLLANCSDADGDTLNLTVSSASASNVPIRVSGGWVFYTPPAGFTNADSFTYSVTDGQGGSATGTVTVAIEADNSQSQNLTITDLGNGSVLIQGSGIPGYTYRLQSSDTAGPFNWSDIPGGSVTADITGAFQYTDTPGGQTRFYRTVYP